MPVPRSHRNRHIIPTNLNPTGTRCVPVEIPDDPEYIAMFYDALASLTVRQRYVPEPEAEQVADLWRHVLSETMYKIGAGIGCEADICEDGSCTEIGAFHPAIAYYPNNPITQPGEEGVYASPPWITGAGFINADGHDAMIDPLALTGASWETLLPTLLPSWTLTFEGEGEIDVQFLSTIQGGACWLYPDGNPLAGDLVDLEYTDITSLFGIETLGELYEILIQGDFDAQVVTHSVKFTTPGSHTLTAQYFPTAELFEPPFIGIGGGLRSIQLCGGATVEEDIVVPYTIALDGDSLNLLADGIVVSEIPKTTLQSFLDKWVDTAGDTMTGQLAHNVSGIAQRYRDTPSTLVGDVRLSSGLWQFSRAAGADEYHDAYGGGVSYQVSQLFAQWSDPSAGGALTGSFRFAANTNWPAVAIRNINAGSSADILHSYDLTALRASLTNAGKWRGAAFDGYDYSSTTWRKQFALVGEWSEDTDASRTGGFALSTSDHEGDKEIIAARYGPYPNISPQLSFFEGVGNSPVDIAYEDALDLAQKLQYSLEKYGLIGALTTLEQPDALELSDFQLCNASYYIAQQLATVIEAAFDDMTTVTADEVIANLISAFQVNPTTANVIFIAFQAAYAERVGVLDDLTNVDDIAAALAANFSLAAFLDWISGYTWAYPETEAVLSAVVTAAWDHNIREWTAIGANTENANCGPTQVFPCGADAFLDFRFGLGHGIELQQGILTPGEGITEEVIAGTPNNSGIWFYVYFDSCTHNKIEYDAYFDEASYLIIIDGYIDDGMGGWTHVLGPYQTGYTDTEATVVINPAVPTAVDRWRIRAENEPSGAPLDRVIRAIRFYDAG